jgi:hypothetical protein
MSIVASTPVAVVSILVLAVIALGIYAINQHEQNARRRQASDLASQARETILADAERLLDAGASDLAELERVLAAVRHARDRIEARLVGDPETAVEWSEAATYTAAFDRAEQRLSGRLDELHV